MANDTTKGKWVIENGKLINTANRVWVEKALTQPYPGQYWRINPRKNNGRPYHIFLPDVAVLNLRHPRRRLLVHVLDGATHTQSEFKMNGYAVFDPISCEVTEELNGRYEVTMKVAYDPWTAQFLTQSAILKVPFIRHNEQTWQLFRITSVSRSMTSKGDLSISVTAAHIFYDLNNRIVLDCKTGAEHTEVQLGDIDGDGVVDSSDWGYAKQIQQGGRRGEMAKLIADIDQDGEVTQRDLDAIQEAIIGKRTLPKVTIVNGSTSGTQALQQILDASQKDAYAIDFDVSSSYQLVPSREYNGVTATNAIMGSEDSVLSLTGGKLYRDNFHFSINDRMEKQSEGGGYIAYGYNMTAVECEVDYSQCFTDLIAATSDGLRATVSMPGVPNKEFPHRIYTYREFSYSNAEYDAFYKAAEAYASVFFKPQLKLSVSFADVYGDDTYEDYWSLADYEVGDEVIVYHKDLGINYGGLLIMKKTYDVVNQLTTSIEIGNGEKVTLRGQDSTTFMGGTVSNGQSKQDKEQHKQQETQKAETAKKYTYWKDFVSAKSTWSSVLGLKWGQVGEVNHVEEAS